MTETILDEAARLVHGDRGTDYGPPSDNHGATGELVTAYLRRKYAGLIYPGFAFDAEDVCWFNILQKCSRDANAPGRDNLVDVAGYAANLEIIRSAP